jgi:hypothetical protein
MKKFIIGLVAVLALVVSSQAQVVHRSRSFLPSDVASVTISNTFMLTNLTTAWVGAGVTNMAGIIYTNNYGVRTIITSAATDNTKNLLQDAPLWALRDGSPPYVDVGTNAASGVDPRVTFASLVVRTIAGSGADQAISLVFTPVYDGVNEATVAAEEWTPTITPTVSATQTFQIDVPVWQFPGASALRLRRITYADTTAASQVTFTHISINGFVPQ